MHIAAYRGHCYVTACRCGSRQQQAVSQKPGTNRSQCLYPYERGLTPYLSSAPCPRIAQLIFQPVISEPFLAHPNPQTRSRLRRHHSNPQNKSGGKFPPTHERGSWRCATYLAHERSFRKHIYFDLAACMKALHYELAEWRLEFSSPKP